MLKRKKDQQTEIREKMREGTGTVIVRHYFKPEELTARTRLCAELCIPPGASIGVHGHVDEDELYIIQRGRGAMTDGDKEFEVFEGDAIATGKGSAHSVRNTGPEDLIITAVIIKY